MKYLITRTRRDFSHTFEMTNHAVGTRHAVSVRFAFSISLRNYVARPSCQEGHLIYCARYVREVIFKVFNSPSACGHSPFVASKWESYNTNTNKKNRLHSQRMETIFILYKTVLTCSDARALLLRHGGRRPLQG